MKKDKLKVKPKARKTFNENYFGRLTVNGLPTATKAERKGLIDWLKSIAKELEKEKDWKIYSSPCRFKLFE